MDLNHPLISLCIPTYNRAPFLREALKSIMVQADDTVEVLISDNDSQDETQEVVKGFQQRYPTIRYFRNEENVGFDRNILLCLHRSQGDYVWFFGDDDILLEGALGYVKAMIKRMEEVSLVYLNFYGFKTDWRNKEYFYLKGEGDKYFRDHNECLRFISHRLGFMSSLVLNRQECLKIGGTSDYIGSGFMHLYLVLLTVLSGKPSVWVSNHYVAQRAENPPPERFDYMIILGYQFQRVFWDCQRKGYSWLIVYRTVNQILWCFIIRKILSMIRYGNTKEVRKCIPILFKVYWVYPLFWCGVIIPFLLPPFFINLTHKIWHFIRYRLIYALSPTGPIKESKVAMSQEGNVLSCPLCNKKGYHSYVKKYGDYTIYRCLSCDLVFSNPMKNPGKEWYEQSDQYSTNRIFHGEETWHHQEFIKDKENYELNLLDIGCGSGVFLWQAQAKGYQVSGLDFDRENIKIAKDSYGLTDVHAMSLEEFPHHYPDKLFDVITFFEILEHMDDLNRFMELIKGRLKPNGVIVLSVPNRERTLDLLGKGDYPPNHLTQWNTKCLKTFLEWHGFEIVKMTVKQLSSDEIASYLSLKIHFGIVKRLCLRGLSRQSNKQIQTQDVKLFKSARILRSMKYSFFKLVALPSKPFLRLLRLDGTGIYCLGRLK